MNDTKLPVDSLEEVLQVAEAALALQESEKEKRVGELRKLYQSGEYKVGALDVAARIIDEHLI